MNILPGIESTSSALAAEKVRLDIIGQNIANATLPADSMESRMPARWSASNRSSWKSV
ncbi:MAG: flagellar basal body protein [Opitutaceae bacterium]|nr:flagellar basal body protein [Opitutaceae bacterium]